MRRLLISIAYLIAIAGSAYAENSIIVEMSGKCEFKLPTTETGPCSDKVNWKIQGGVSSISFFYYSPNGSGIFNLIGNSEQQPTPTNYYLFVSRLDSNWNGKEIQSLDVEGVCHIILKEDGSEYYSINCSIYNTEMGLSFYFSIPKIDSVIVKRL